ncbi:MAG TPA: sulfide/dihydroorotate dehydrogenase-like FAD/NAD-binding protein [Planctomycetota bacterium]|jgi:ferredoxin--NADP+ reductase
MTKILQKRTLAKDIFEMIVDAPQVAAKAQPGHFIIAMADAAGERVPLTIADFDRQKGTITLVFMVVGSSSLKLSRLKEGDNLYAFTGPLGHPSDIENYGKVIMVAGGVGAAPVYPIARAFREKGQKVITIHGARTKDLIFWEDKMRSVSDEYILTTDDGSAGRKGLVTDPLKELLAADTGKQIGCVYAIGPTIMMKFCALATKPFGAKTIVSLNTIMVDGTGMCGGCRVSVGGQTLFTCVDGPEFDGHAVEWDLLMSRQRVYCSEEKCSLTRYVEATKV